LAERQTKYKILERIPDSLQKESIDLVERIESYRGCKVQNPNSIFHTLTACEHNLSTLPSQLCLSLIPNTLLSTPLGNCVVDCSLQLLD
jgi:hypothetical protein